MLESKARQLQQDIANLYLQFPELQGDDEMLRVDMLEGATDIKELLTVALRAVEDARALRDGTRARLDDLKARGDRFKMRIEFLRAMITKILASAQLKKIELPEATLTMVNRAPHLIGDPDPATLPDDLCHIIRQPNMGKIKDLLLAGGVVDGFALSNSEPSLTVRVK